MSERSCKRFHLDASHGDVSSLYRAVCDDCAWISADSREPGPAQDEGQRHLEGRPMPWQEAPESHFAPPLGPPLPGWPSPEELERERQRKARPPD